ncbi:hypothetical protein KUV57_12825 [Epibacterium sp. DP7N7-1]|nr:hypothetical protein [Epibacterium sp. DP7N7-1]
MTIPELKRQAVEIARLGTFAEAASLILGLCRQIRKECLGQAPGIPDLSKHNGQTAEGALIYEYLPELSARLLKNSGAEMLRSSEERVIPSIDHFDDTDLRLAIGDCMRSSRFAAISARLRLQLSPRSFATEVLACEDNPVEIVTSRLIPALEAAHPAYSRDFLEIDRHRSVRRQTNECEEIAPCLEI